MASVGDGRAAVRLALWVLPKRRVLKKAAACKKPREIGALLRREGLYSSHLVVWRRGPEAQKPDPRDKQIVELGRGDTNRLARGSYTS